MSKFDQFQNFDTANFFALVISILILMAFIFVPWYGKDMTDNGAALFANNLYRLPGTLAAPLIGLIWLEVVCGLGFAILGILKPETERLTALLASLSSLFGFVYFINTYVKASQLTPGTTFGLGWWITMALTIVLSLHVFLAHLPFRHIFPKRQIDKPKSKAFVRSIPLFFLIPGLILYSIWIIFPTFYTFYLSLTNWDGISAPAFVGFKNFARLFKDPTFIESLVNNLRWLLIFITLPTASGLALAMFFNNDRPGNRFFKISFFLPLVISLPVIGLIWAWLYNPRLGLINSILVDVFNVASPPGWLGDRNLAIWCVIAAAVWRQVGYVMVLYLAGLKGIDLTLLDASQVDGCSKWQTFRHVIFPLLAPITTIVVVISIIDSLRAFDLVSVMTRGNQSTQVLANFMYIEAFNNYRMGYGAAIAVILFAISLVFIIIYLMMQVKDEMEY
ncbi:MAG: sugar ABC transporter permease [Anaerolineae bacterium]|jgi:ABC-type sugar transport system permease subunit|nr:sugar ABC transporter permease [Anaerolineae bacterium]